jgi:hypothetical protein
MVRRGVAVQDLRCQEVVPQVLVPATGFVIEMRRQNSEEDKREIWESAREVHRDAYRIANELRRRVV